MAAERAKKRRKLVLTPDSNNLEADKLLVPPNGKDFKRVLHSWCRVVERSCGTLLPVVKLWLVKKVALEDHLEICASDADDLVLI